MRRPQNLKKLPLVLAKQLFLLRSVKKSGRFFQIFVAFSEKLNFIIFPSENISTHYVALSKILYSAGGFQDFLNSVKNAVLMPENAKKNHKEIGYPVVPCIRPDFDWLFDIYLFNDMKNSKSKDEEKICH